MRPAHLTIHRELCPPQEHKVDGDETLIGRGNGCDVQIPDPGMSREHAMISWEADHYSIEDLQTTNGTRLNRRRIRSAHLAHGDEISIAGTHIVFRFLDGGD